MTDSQIPQDLENQLAGPGGQFPGTAETLATPVGSDTPVRVGIGQAANKHLQLSRKEFRARSARQREIDAQTDVGDARMEPQMRCPGPPDTQPPPNPPLGTNLSAAAKNAQQTSNATPPPPPEIPIPGSRVRKSRARPKSVKSKPKPVGAQPEKLIGQPSPAPSTTAAPTPSIPIPTDAMLEQRMSRLERGMNMIVRAIADRDARVEHEVIDVVPSAPPQDATTAFAELDEELQDDEPIFEEVVPEEEEINDEPPPCVATQVEDNPELDKGLQKLQQMILKRNPQKVFRQYWCQLSRAAQYNEWPPERREAFDEVFNSMVAHPKFVHQMSKFLRGSRSGNCIGNEQIARVCGMVAGFLTVYQLAAAGR